MFKSLCSVAVLLALPAGLSAQPDVQPQTVQAAKQFTFSHSASAPIDWLKGRGVAEVKLTEYPEAEHDCWTETYRNPELYDWFLKHQRKP